jgi:hypothetical protein
MILRFRIEAENHSKELLEDELAEWASKFQQKIMLEHQDDLCGNWEATDDVVYKNHKNPDTYRGRIVLKFNLLGDEHDWVEFETVKACRACGKSIPKLGGYALKREEE